MRRGTTAMMIGGVASFCVCWKYFVAFLLNWSVIHAKVIEQYSLTEETTGLTMIANLTIEEEITLPGAFK